MEALFGFMMFVGIYFGIGLPIGFTYGLSEYRKEVKDKSRYARRGRSEAERIRKCAQVNTREALSTAVAWPLYVCSLIAAGFGILFHMLADLIARKELTEAERAEADARAAKIVAEYKAKKDAELKAQFDELEGKPKKATPDPWEVLLGDQSFSRGGVIEPKPEPKHEIVKKALDRSYGIESIRYSCRCGYKGQAFSDTGLRIDFHEHRNRCRAVEGES